MIADISERKQAETEKIQKEKLQGVIEMAGSVCHELNQPLMALSGYTELVLLDTKKDDPNFDKFAKIREQSEIMSDVTLHIQMHLNISAIGLTLRQSKYHKS